MTTVYETPPTPSNRYAVEWYNGGIWNRSMDTYRKKWRAKKSADIFARIGYPARVIDTEAKD